MDRLHDTDKAHTAGLVRQKCLANFSAIDIPKSEGNF